MGTWIQKKRMIFGFKQYTSLWFTNFYPNYFPIILMPVAAKGKRLFGLTMIFWQCKKKCDTFLNFWYKKNKKTSTKKRIKMRRKKTWKFERIFLSCFAFFSSSQKLGSDSSCCPTCHCALSIRLIEDPGGWHHKVGVGGLASPTVTILKKIPLTHLSLDTEARTSGLDGATRWRGFERCPAPCLIRPKHPSASSPLGII